MQPLVKPPKGVSVPLSADQVARFWSSFRASRDLAMVGLMVVRGMRSREVLALNTEDLLESDSEIRVAGKGGKPRVLPLAPDTAQLLDHYLQLERPVHCGSALFVCLKGRVRGSRMRPAGLRSLFLPPRRTTGVPPTHPHPFRAPFAQSIVPASGRLPAL